MPAGLSAMEKLKWKREHAQGKSPAKSRAKLPAPPAGAEGGMPAGLTKIDQLKWKREHGGRKPCDPPTTPPAHDHDARPVILVVQPPTARAAVRR
jgi:hypothetical protein